MAGVRKLYKTQLGVESTSGTAVAATTIWRGHGDYHDDRNLQFIDEDAGYMTGATRTATTALDASGNLDGVATFEQLPYVLAGAVGDTAYTGVKDGAGDGYIYTAAFPTTSQLTPKTYTLELGDNNAVKEAEFVHFPEFTLSGKPKEAVMLASKWRGRQMSTSSFTGGLTLPTVEEILFNKSKLYIDATGGTMGATLKSNTLLGFELAVKSGYQAVFTGDGALYWTFLKQTMFEAILKVTFEYDAIAAAAQAVWIAETAALVSVVIQGSAVATGTSYSFKTLKINLPGQWETFDTIGEVDGNDIITGTFRARYSPNDASSGAGTIIVVNALSALP